MICHNRVWDLRSNSLVQQFPAKNNVQVSVLMMCGDVINVVMGYRPVVMYQRTVIIFSAPVLEQPVLELNCL